MAPTQARQDGQQTLAQGLARGVGRLLADHGQVSLVEFSLKSGRRVDVIGLDARGRFTVVEIKSSLEDFRGDRKWPEYLDYCDRFFFAVPDFFPREILPVDCGLMVADPFSAVILRESPTLTLNAARRRSLLLQFAQTAARRLAATQG